MAHHGKLIDQRDIHTAKNIFQQLDHLSRICATYSHHLSYDLAVKGTSQAQTCGGNPSYDLGRVDQVKGLISRIDPLRGIG